MSGASSIVTARNVSTGLCDKRFRVLPRETSSELNHTILISLLNTTESSFVNIGAVIVVSVAVGNNAGVDTLDN